MAKENYSRELEFAFADLVNLCSRSFSSSDLDKLLPLLHFSSENGNYEASLILGLYFDPDGCLFNDFPEHTSKKVRSVAIDYYKKANQQASRESSDRAKRVKSITDNYK